MATARQASALEVESDPITGAGPSAVPSNSYMCDACDQPHEGPPFGSGLFIWTRGDEVRFEEPPLCEECASRITIGALVKWSWEEEGEG